MRLLHKCYGLSSFLSPSRPCLSYRALVAPTPKGPFLEEASSVSNPLTVGPILSGEDQVQRHNYGQGLITSQRELHCTGGLASTHMLQTVRIGRREASSLKSQRRGLQLHPTVGAELSLRPRVVIYDGVCHLCNAGVRWIIQADKKKQISFCAVQSRAAEPYLLALGLTRENVLRRFVFVEGPSVCHQASTAALKVASYLPPPYSALTILMVFPVPIRDAVYDYVAKRRYEWFGRSSECIVPDEDVWDRFVDKRELQELALQDESEEEEG